VTVTWTAPGDDWLCGQADRYQVILASGEIGSPSDGTVATEADAAAASGGTENVSLTAAQVAGMTHAAVLYRDEAGNWGLLKDVALPSPPGGGPPPPGPDPPTPGPGPGPVPGPGPDAGDCSNSIAGTSDDDKLRGGDGSDRIRGLGGADRINSGAGDDCVSGQGGADRLNGASGDDQLKGGRGKDLISGGSGDDVIRVRRGGPDRIDCGPGDDTVFLNRMRDQARNCERMRAK
jgi:hypothetical protein